MVWVSLKSKRVVTSRRAWSSALVSSAGSNSETTSNENSATRVQDRVDAGIHRGGGQAESDERAHDEQRADADGALVQWLEWRFVVRVRPEVEVVDPVLLGSLDQFVQNRFAAWWERLAFQVGDHLPEVVASSAKLGDDQVEGRGGGRRRVLPAQVGDDAVEAHIGDSFRSRGHCAGDWWRPTYT